MKDKAFASRLKKACDDVSHVIPEKGEGRLVVLAKKLDMSEEAVRRWFNGESRPRVRVMKNLAKLLETDEAWLSLGIKAGPRGAEAVRLTSFANGAVHLALGYAMAEGGNCAIPDDADPRKGFVDFYMTINSKLSAFRAALGVQIEADKFEFVVPHEYEQVKNVGFLFSPEGFAFTKVIDLQHGLITKHKESKGGDYAVTVREKDDRLVTGRDQWPEVKSFGELA